MAKKIALIVFFASYVLQTIFPAFVLVTLIAAGIAALVMVVEK